MSTATNDQMKTMLGDSAYFTEDQARQITDKVSARFDDSCSGLIAFTVNEICLTNPSVIAAQFIKDLFEQS